MTENGLTKERILKIWLLQIGEPLPIQSDLRKLRTALLADKLLERGFSVCWWGSAFEHQRKLWISNKDRDFFITPNFRIRALRGCGYHKNVSIARYLDHRIIAWKFRKQAKLIKKPDIIVASMPCYHFAYEGMRYARRNEIPLLVDIRDPWPDIFLTPLEKIGLDKLGKILLAFDFRRLSILLREANGLVATSKGFLQWGLNKIGRSQGELDEVFYHGYKKGNKESTGDSPIHIDAPKKKIILFIGTFGDSYELKLILKVSKRFYKNGNTDILFLLAGTGTQFEDIKKEVEHLPNVILPGWLSKQEIKKLLVASWAGIIPCRSAKNTAPNKVFEYLSAGLPLISSLEGEIEDLIENFQIGLNYKPGDSEGLYRCIHKLILNSDLWNKMSLNALRFFKEHGDADKIYGEYAEFVEKVAEYDRISNRRM
ncbi:MAG: glycosyltransferase [Nitrospinales bacterium]